jgi:hypothetical protein
MQFHDWTLVDVVFEWARASVTVALDGPSSRCVLLAEEVSLLEVPRENPWGRSVSVNSLSIADMPDRGGQYLEIEMQSGDVIRVNAKKIAVQE